MKIKPAKAKKNMTIRKIIVSICAVLVVFSFASTAWAGITIETVTVGNPGNAADKPDNNPMPRPDLGIVGYIYDIGKYDVTLTQYTAFLNAVAKTDTYGLYAPMMAKDLAIAGISRSGTQGSYSYAVMGDGQRPVTYVSWFSAARFANWLSNGQKAGAQDSTTTEDGAYTLNGAMSGIIATNPKAQWYIPSENEWYKAAYYDPNKGGPGVGGYWASATKAKTLSGNSWENRTAPNEANYTKEGKIEVPGTATTLPLQGTLGNLTPVGAFTNSVSAYGTYDQSGNVWQWTDGVFRDTKRAARGGAWDCHMHALLASPWSCQNLDPVQKNHATGFRVVRKTSLMP